MNKTRLGISLRNSKKAALPMQYIIIAMILLITAFIIIAVFTGLFGKQKEQIEGQIDSLGDYDGDGVVNMFDKCPCEKTLSGDEEQFKGCATKQALNTAKTSPKPTCPPQK
ncbi:hypothetical protein GF336_07030 [Candidatus Woesearchaeota archaeon]|nr:hypothetical protein [Candidatus Woesearchaeota archaeon]